MTTEVERLPPQDLDAERSLLGSLLIDSDAVSAISGKIQSDDFYREQHRAIFDAVTNIATRNERSDSVTVSDELRRTEHLELAGGPSYIADLINAVPTAFHVEHYAAIVRRTGILRRIIQSAGQMVAAAYRAGADPDAVLDDAERLIFSIANEMRTRDFELLREVLHVFEEQLMFRMEHRGVLSGVATGINHLDQLTGGLQRSDLIILAARPGMGKTAFALHMALHAAMHNDIPVGFFAMEMPGHQLAQRIVGNRARIDSMRIRDGELDPEQLQKTVAAMAELAEYPILIDDSPSLTVLELRGKARRMHMEHTIGLLIIDYLQLMSSGTYRDNRVQEITEITRSLKSLARELNIPVVACAQLSRAVEQRPNPTPRLSDLRESGSIEQDADVVVFLHEPNRDDEEAIGRPVDLRLTIAKQRNGPVGELDLRFVRSHGRFEETAERSL